MAKHRFKLSDMIRHAWFFKLRFMRFRGSKDQSMLQSMKRSQPPNTAPPKATKLFPSPRTKILPNRTSYYISSRAETEKSIESPRRSKKRSRREPMKDPRSVKLVTSSVSAGCSCRMWKTESISVFPALGAVPKSLQHLRHRYVDRDHNGLCKTSASDRLNFDRVASWSTFDVTFTSSASDIIIDVGRKTSTNRKLDKFNNFNELSEFELTPILTKTIKEEAEPTKFEDKSVEGNVASYHNASPVTEQSKSPVKRSSPGLHRSRKRANSPGYANKKLQAHCNRRSCLSTTAAVMQQRKGLSGSLAVVKSSSDPQRDFRDSMVEMIVENNLWASKDLEELLACYLSLNSNEYHSVIVKVFEQIWFELTNL